MKTLGLIGGMSWYSTAMYYTAINQLTAERLGGSHSAKLLLYSLDFHEFRACLNANDWDGVEAMVGAIAERLERAGADCIVMCTNTPHIVADRVQARVRIPLINIAEETSKVIVKRGLRTVGLLGTAFTMEHPFFVERLAKQGITALIPGDEERAYIQTSIFGELTKGVLNNGTRNRYLEIIQGLKVRGAQGIIFGCTEISLLVNQEQSALPVFDTTAIHAKAAVDFALGA